MATFYEFCSGHHAHLINIDDVRRVRLRDRATKGEFETVIEFKNETEVVFFGRNHIEHLRQMSQPIIPAAPGFYVLTFFYRDETPSAAAVLGEVTPGEPILAWRCCAIWPEPVVIWENEPSYHAGERAILYPNGLVVAPGEQAWPNIDTWAQYVCERWTEWHEKRKSAA